MTAPTAPPPVRITRTRTRTRLATVGGLVALTACLVVASLIHQATPNGAAQVGPIVVSADYGEWATGRTFEAQAGDARFANTVESASSLQAIPSSGRWLVVDLNVACMIESCMVQNVTLMVGGVEYSATERLGYDTLGGGALAARIVSAGSVAFELPRDITERPGAGAAELRMADTIDIRLDSQLRFEFDLTELPQLDTVTVQRPVLVEAR